MKLNTTLPNSLKPYYKTALEQYTLAYNTGNLKQAWHQLERAHVIGQQYPFAHSFVHWKMLQFGFKIKNSKEVLGQIPRLIFGGVKSFIGKVPIGNPGGANVPPLQPFPISEEIQDVFKKAGVQLS